MVQIYDLFGNKTAWKLIRFFLSNPTGQFSQGKVIQEVKLAKATAIAGFRVLERLGIVGFEEIGRTKLYRLNRELTFVKQIKRVVNLTASFLDEIIEPFRGALVKVVAFGSFARGEDREDSDVDLLFVGDVDDSLLQKATIKIEKKCGKRMSVIVRTPEQFILMKEKEPVLWNKILVGGEVLYGTGL